MSAKTDLEAREAELARKEANQVLLQNPNSQASVVTDGGIQEGRLRCKDQTCPKHWEHVPLKVRVEELHKFMDLAPAGSRDHHYSPIVLDSHVFYYPQESIICECGTTGVVIPPGGQSAFDSEFDERIAEAGPSLADTGNSRMQRIKQLQEHEAMVKSLQNGAPGPS